MTVPRRSLALLRTGPVVPARVAVDRFAHKVVDRADPSAPACHPQSDDEGEVTAPP